MALLNSKLKSELSSELKSAPKLKLNTELKRYPYVKKELLKAWDSADELILENLSEIELKDKRILIVNDSFGALSSALEKLTIGAANIGTSNSGTSDIGASTISSYTDSYVSSRAIQLNSENRITSFNQLEELSGVYDLVLIRIPKNMSFFEDILCHLTHHLHSDSKIICGSMIKHLAKAAFDLLNQYLGATHTSLAQKKARLIFAGFQKAQAQSPYPIKISIPPFENPFINHSNLFSREKLDIGTRFLLDHIPQGNFKTILDLGCANGIIGIAAKRSNPLARIIFSDESKMAILSAHTNYQNYFSDPAEYYWTHCYEDQKPHSVDLVLCNPPFHQGSGLNSSIAWQMFKDAHHALTPKGKIRIIGNTHLNYQIMLKKIFGNARTVATNNKFTILESLK